MQQIFEELITNFKDLSRRVSHFETWEPRQGIIIKSAHAYRTTNQSPAAGIWVTVAFDTTLWDTDGLHTSGVFIAPTDGLYLVKGVVTFSTFVGTYNIRILTSTSAAYLHAVAFDSSFSPMTISGIYQMSAGETAEIQVYHASSSVTLLGSGSNPYQTFGQFISLAVAI